MSVIKVEKNKNYTVIGNEHLRNKHLSLKAKGLLTVALFLPDNWEYSINGLVAICKENETAIKSTLNELKDSGYLTINKLMPNETDTGRIEYIYTFYENSIIKKQEVEKQGVEILGVENHTQLNTNILNTNNINNISSSDNEEERELLAKRFEYIWNIYPKKKGKLQAMEHYYKWLKGKKICGHTVKLTAEQMRDAVNLYKNECEYKKTEEQYIKQGDTFFSKVIYDYALKAEEN